jgi:hypothetical protein
VYRARDLKLDREVAIKVLPEPFAHDPERRARFEREAKTLASLNHPNIASIHGFEESPESGQFVGALVLEIVEGPTLADRIAQGPIAFDEVLPIACQLADALQAAHDLGVIHRDLKPANIKVRPDVADMLKASSYLSLIRWHALLQLFAPVQHDVDLRRGALGELTIDRGDEVLTAGHDVDVSRVRKWPQCWDDSATQGSRPHAEID